MKKLVFATNNKHKLEEVREILGTSFEVLSLSDIECHEDIPETADTLEGNALLKARYVKEHYGYDCFADDTGLEVEALGGEPGVRSARYDDVTDHDSEANMRKLLRNLEGKEMLSERRAQFRTVIALIQSSSTDCSEKEDVHLFEGIVKGYILHEKHGKDGFGYDPVFAPSEDENVNVDVNSLRTFAEMSSAEKNAISHRGRATQKLIKYLHISR